MTTLIIVVGLLCALVGISAVILWDLQRRQEGSDGDATGDDLISGFESIRSDRDDREPYPPSMRGDPRRNHPLDSRKVR